MSIDQDDADMAALALPGTSADPVALSFEEIVAQMDSGALDVRSTAEFDEDGDGFVYLPNDDKNRLCNVPFFIVKVKWMNGQYGPGVKVSIVTKNDNRISFTDFSTGIARQLSALVDEDTPRWTGAIACLHGLVRSDYQGPVGPATTYYLDTQGGSLPAGEL